MASIDAINAIMVKFFAETKKSVIEQLEPYFTDVAKADTTDNDAGKILASIKIGWVDLVEPITKHLTNMAKDGASEAATQIDIANAKPDPFFVINDKAVDWAKDHAAKLVGMKYVDGELVPNPNYKGKYQIADTTREFLKDVIVESMQDGSTYKEISKKITDVYLFSDERAEVIARTETAFADVAGNMITYKEGRDNYGIEVKKSWITAGDSDVSDDCLLNEAQGPIGLDDVFASGADAPPEHPNCRCDLVPEVVE
jgi:SPP1 gp7 family putative phage head morphogenesis protein